ncbi:unnamed protein product, partial [Laminaria digitata]
VGRGTGRRHPGDRRDHAPRQGGQARRVHGYHPGDGQREPPQHEARGPQRVQVVRHPYPPEGGEDQEVDRTINAPNKPPYP